MISHMALTKFLELKLNFSVFHVASNCTLETQKGKGVTFVVVALYPFIVVFVLVD